MRSPYDITEPTTISFSGGRTSAYMLWRVLQQNGGLPDNCHVLFANTGKEHEKTLEFVQACSEQWAVPIIWLEFRSQKQFAVVNFQTASRNGDPFELLCRERQYLPNPIARFCTVELKIRTMIRYCRSIGLTDFTQMIGIRADEPRRAAKMRSESRRISTVMPLAEDGVTIRDIGSFWDSQNFGLELESHNGRTLLGNCDLCFLKGSGQILSIIREDPERADWWVKMEEEKAGITNSVRAAYFRKDRPSYREMQVFARSQSDMFDDSVGVDCFCGDRDAAQSHQAIPRPDGQSARVCRAGQTDALLRMRTSRGDCGSHCRQLC